MAEGSVVDVVSFWDRRHTSGGVLSSGGHISLDESANLRFYQQRLSLLVELIGDHGSSGAPLAILDAGCGKGWFSARLAEMGHMVDGFDPSPAAVAAARRAAPSGRFSIATLAAYDAPRTYDVVASIDVLFHILDDEEWEASLRRLISLTSSDGLLIVADASYDEPTRLGTYIRFRPASMYAAVAAEYQLVYRGFHAYGFRELRSGFHVFEPATSWRAHA